jgi:acetoin utilization protein AcuB
MEAKVTRDVMTKKVTTALSNERLEMAFRRMIRHGIRHMPVTNTMGQLVGLISDRDFRRAMNPDTRDFVSFLEGDEDFDPGCTVGDFMSWPVKTVHEDTPLRTVASIMIENKISSLPVMREGRLVGIITPEDFMRLYVTPEAKQTRPVTEWLRGATAQLSLAPTP